MDLAEFLTYGGGALFAFLTLIQVAPIQINPWSFIARTIGNAMNKELLDKVDSIDKEIKDLRSDCDERDATLNRTHILHFNDEILHQKEHTKEHFDQIMDDITNYENYCNTHPNYKNNKAVCAIDNIKSTYKKCMDKNSFL